MQIIPRGLAASHFAAGEQAITIRRAGPSDVAPLAKLLAGLSARSQRLRYLSAQALTHEQIMGEAQRMTGRQGAGHLTLIASVRHAGATTAVGVAELARDSAAPSEAELAIVIADDYQAAGLGARILRILARRGRTMGIRMLRADALAENRGLLRLLNAAGLAYTSTVSAGQMQVVVGLGGDS